MFCGKCGAQNSIDAKFCTVCGAPMNTIQNGSGRTAAASSPVQADQRNRIIGIAAVAVLAIAVIIVLVALLGGRGYKSTVNQFLNATFEADAKTMMSLIPDDMVDLMLLDMGYAKKEAREELAKELQDELDYITRYLGDDWKYSYKILGAENVSTIELRELKDEYAQYNVKVSAAKNVEVAVTVETDDFENTNTIEIPVIKVGRSWYLDAENIASIF